MAQKINLDTLNIDQLNLYWHKAVKMKNTGTILTFSGVVMGVTGCIFKEKIVDALLEYDDDPYRGFAEMGVIFTSVGVGIATAVVGFSLRASGNRRKTKAELAIYNYRYNRPQENSMALGVGITLRF